MPRTIRVEYPGAIYHVMDQGDRREDIFVNDVDRHDFLQTRRDWCLGSEAFKAQMIELMDGKLGESHSGALHRERAEQKAERVIVEASYSMPSSSTSKTRVLLGGMSGLGLASP